MHLYRDLSKRITYPPTAQKGPHVGAQADRLILKASHAMDASMAINIKPKAKFGLDAKVDAYAEVAADVLDICMTPFAFKVALREARIATGPKPAAGVAASNNPRKEWERKMIRLVTEALEI